MESSKEPFQKKESSKELNSSNDGHQLEKNLYM
jgi:hypothetical protein